MPLPWIKMWLEALDDPKLTRLSLAERGAWWDIIKLAGKCDADGKIVSGGEGLSIDEIADALHIKTAEDRHSLESMIAKMTERGSLIWNGNALTVVHYEERQRIPPSARPEAVAERVRRYRERRKGGDVVVKGEGDATLAEAKELFDLWNSLGVIKHKKLTGDMTRAIKAASRDFSTAEISQAMKNYARIVNDEQCYFKYRWTLKDFLGRGLEKFLNLETALSNYRKGDSHGRVEKRETDTHQRGAEKLGQWKVTESGGEEDAGDQT